MRRFASAVTLLALAVPAAATATETSDPAPSQSPAQACKAQRTAMGAAAFKALYGTNKTKSNAFGRCVAKQAKADDAATETAKQNAAKACKAEQADGGFAAAHDGKTFQQVYGTGKNGRNAFGKCVSGKAKAAAEAAHTERMRTIVNAARTCRGELASMGKAAFDAKYGTNASKSNAFGKCVSKQASSKSSNQS
jgi:hypothetical protein